MKLTVHFRDKDYDTVAKRDIEWTGPEWTELVGLVLDAADEVKERISKYTGLVASTATINIPKGSGNPFTEIRFQLAPVQSNG